MEQQQHQQQHQRLEILETLNRVEESLQKVHLQLDQMRRFYDDDSSRTTHLPSAVSQQQQQKQQQQRPASQQRQRPVSQCTLAFGGGSMWRGRLGAV